MDNIYLHAEEMIYIWKEKGRLSNEDMDRLNICKSPVDEHKDRDNLCLSQQGPVCLTHEETRKRELDWNERKAFAATNKAALEVERQRERTRAIAIAVLTKEANIVKKRADATAFKAIEVHRKAALTNEEKAQEAAAAKLAKEAKSEASTLKKAKLLQDARDLVGAH
jgi:hypothetical protein